MNTKDLQAELASALAEIRDSVQLAEPLDLNDVRDTLDAAIAALSEHGGGGEAVAWRFYMTGSGWLNDQWSGWSADTGFRRLCEKLGFAVEYAYAGDASPKPRGEGMVLVPREATEAMLNAAIGVKRPIVQAGPSMHIGKIWSAEIYAAMLAAAPGEGSGEDGDPEQQEWVISGAPDTPPPASQSPKAELVKRAIEQLKATDGMTFNPGLAETLRELKQHIESENTP